jgi:hypothetical protein
LQRWRVHGHCGHRDLRKLEQGRAVLQIESEPPQTLVADPDAPDADSFKNKDYEFYALKAFIALTRKSHGVVVKTYNACRVE